MLDALKGLLYTEFKADYDINKKTTITNYDYTLSAPSYSYDYSPHIIISSPYATTQQTKKETKSVAPQTPFQVIPLTQEYKTQTSTSGLRLENIAIIAALGFVGYKVVDKLL